MSAEIPRLLRVRMVMFLNKPVFPKRKSSESDDAKEVFFGFMKSTCYDPLEQSKGSNSSEQPSKGQVQQNTPEKDTFPQQETLALNPSHFYKCLPKIAVAQICQSIGFKSSQISALETLSDIAGRYMEALAGIAVSAANSAGRTQSNLLDVVSAMEVLNSPQGFRSAWNVKQSLMKSKTLEDAMIFLRTTDEIPFAKPIPRTNSRNKETTTMDSSVTRPLPVHIPNWLPRFPDPSTYQTGIEAEKEEMQKRVSGELEKTAERKVRSGERELELGVKRPKIRFRIGDGGGGIDLRSGICRGSKRRLHAARPALSNSLAFLLTVILLFMILSNHQMSPNFMLWVVLGIFLMATSLRIYATCQQLQAQAQAAHALATSGFLGHTELHLQMPPSIALAARGELHGLRLQLALLDRDFDALDYETTLRALDSENVPQAPAMSEEEINALPVHVYKVAGAPSGGSSMHKGSSSASTLVCHLLFPLLNIITCLILFKMPSYSAFCEQKKQESSEAVGTGSTKAADDELTCTVCLEQVNDGKLVRSLPCLHIVSFFLTFHASCIDPWLRHQGTFPVCKFRAGSGRHEHGQNRADGFYMV
ncbi:Zinc finger, RING-type [Dillenia turbinata]|uniref:RING-type E3 ubiquitin transferase n=1 Tax=Dillenia turbinata TaxID=194707 RepID=A0AAN8V871_9MAGN